MHNVELNGRKIRKYAQNMHINMRKKDENGKIFAKYAQICANMRFLPKSRILEVTTVRTQNCSVTLARSSVWLARFPAAEVLFSMFSERLFFSVVFPHTFSRVYAFSLVFRGFPLRVFNPVKCVFCTITTRA